MKRAVIVGASSGIGKELARLLARKGHVLGLTARRGELLQALREELPSETYIRISDVRSTEDTRKDLTDLIAEMGGVDLVILCAGIGHLNPDLDLDKELETIATNVQGFTVAANVAFRHFLRQGHGHLVGISSLAALRGNRHAPAYNASKAYMSNYLQGLAQKAARSCPAIAVTDIQPGFVDTDLAKGVGLFWVAPAAKAAEQIYVAIERRTSHAYVTRRWRLIAWLLKTMPDFVYNRF